MASMMEGMTGKMRDRARMAKFEKLDRDNERLRDEVSTLRSRLDREREEHEGLLDAMKKRPVVKQRRRGGLMRWLVIGGGAYVLGARAGRERYEQIMSKAGELRERVMGQVQEQMDQQPGGSSSGQQQSQQQGSMATTPGQSPGAPAGTTGTTGTSGTSGQRPGTAA
jgi:hypothetical protein